MEYPDNPTNLHVFLAAQPGAVVSVIVRSNIPKPRTTEQIESLRQTVAEQSGLPYQYLTYLTTNTLWGEPWEEPEPAEPMTNPMWGEPEPTEPKANGLFVPDGHGRIIVPGKE